MLHTLRFFFSSKCRLFHNATFFGSCVIHILYTGCAKIKKKKFRRQRVNYINDARSSKYQSCQLNANYLIHIIYLYNNKQLIITRQFAHSLMFFITSLPKCTIANGKIIKSHSDPRVDAECLSETSLRIYRPVCCNIQEDCCNNIKRCDNL